MMAESKNGAIRTLGIWVPAFLGICLCIAGVARATVVKSIRTGSEQAYVRIVIETNDRLAPRPKVSTEHNILTISLSGVENDPSALNSEAYRDDLVNIDVTHTSAKTRIKTTLAYTPTRIRTFFLIDPHRFVIDAYRPSADTTAGTAAAEKTQPATDIEEDGTRLNEINQKADETGRSNRPSGTPASNHSSADDGRSRKTFQQRLLVFLIVMTSVALIVIIVLMCMNQKPD